MKPTAVQNIDECKPISELHLLVTWQDHSIKTMSTRIANACASNILTGRITGTFVSKTLRCSTALASQLKFEDRLPVTAWLHTQQRDFASISQIRATMLSRSLKKILRQQRGSSGAAEAAAAAAAAIIPPLPPPFSITGLDVARPPESWPAFSSSVGINHDPCFEQS